MLDLVIFVEFVMGFCWFVVPGGELWWPEEVTFELELIGNYDIKLGFVELLGLDFWKFLIWVLGILL